jgi:hypothetical protein
MEGLPMPELPVIVDVAIGVVFVFLMFSLLVTWLLEVCASLLHFRSNHLAKVVQNLLELPHDKLKGARGLQQTRSAGKQPTLAENATAALYNHPLIRRLSEPGKLPSHIATSDFSSALLDVLVEAGRKGGKPGLTALHAGIQTLKSEDAKKALSALIEPIGLPRDDARGDPLSVARKSIEDWFDRSMQGAEGWYRVHSAIIAFIIAVLLAVSFNVDSLGIAQTLWRDAALRDSLVAASQAYIAENDEAKVEDTRQEIEKLGLPIGWSFATDDGDPDTPFNTREFPVTSTGWLLKGVGLFVTAFSISQGAPLWFDFLKKYVNIRLAEPRVEKEAGAK